MVKRDFLIKDVSILVFSFQIEEIGPFDYYTCLKRVVVKFFSLRNKISEVRVFLVLVFDSFDSNFGFDSMDFIFIFDLIDSNFLFRYVGRSIIGFG